MFYVFLVICAAIGIGIYLLFILKLVPGAAEERLGVLEPLPPDLGEWKEDHVSEAGKRVEAEGLLREVRHYYYEGKAQLVQQVRYRDAKSREIVRVEPEETLKRRRVRS